MPRRRSLLAPTTVAAVVALAVVALAAGCQAGSAQGQGAAGEPRSSAASPSPTVAALPAAHRTRIGGKPCGVLVVGDDVWVSVYAEDRLVRVDRRTGAVKSSTDVGSQPCGLAAGAG